MSASNPNSCIALVTGATGFTGGHLARTLLQRGCAVRALVRSASAAAKLRLAGMDVVEGDLTDRDAVRAAVRGCSHVYHIAALYRSSKHPDSVYHDVNVTGTRHVLEAARELGARRTVHCSTVGVHGDVATIPADEQCPLHPGDVYQRTKVQGEQVAMEAMQRGQDVCVFRPVGIYGPGDTRFLKLFKAIHTGRFRMIGSGRVLYHMTFIDDLVAGIMLCGERPEAKGRTYILGGPRYTTLAELAQEVARAVGRPLPRGRLPLWPLKLGATLCEAVCKPLKLEPPLHHRRLDFFTKNRAFTSERAQRELGYSPKVDLAQGLALTAQWYFQNGYLKDSLSRASHAKAATPTH